MEIVKVLILLCLTGMLMGEAAVTDSKSNNVP